MIWLLPVISPLSVSLDGAFRVSRIVRSLGSIYTINNVTRDGQFYGSYGFYWPSNGGEDAAYIRNGKAYEIKFDRTMPISGPSSAIGWKAPDTVLVNDLDHGGQVYECKVDSAGKARSLKKSRYSGPWHSLGDPAGSAIYKPESDSRWWGVGEEYLAPRQVTMYKISHGYRVGDVTIEVNMVDEHGVAIQLPNGRTTPLTGTMKQLKGIIPRRLLAVGKEGWFAIEATKDTKDDYFWYVIWIEPQVKKGQKKP